MDEIDHSLEGVNLQAIITTFQTQRQDSILPDQLRKIEWALCSEFNGPLTKLGHMQTKGIMTIKESIFVHNPKEQRKRGRKRGPEKCRDSPHYLGPNSTY